jgi:hypothetical protein
MTASLGDDDLRGCADAVSVMFALVDRDPAALRAATNSLAALWSEVGYLGGPDSVRQLAEEAMQVGYLLAVQDANDGALGDVITS